MKIRSNCPSGPALVPLSELQHGDVFRLHNHSLQSIIEGSNPAYLRGFVEHSAAAVPATGISQGNQTAYSPGTKVYKINATLLIDP